MFGSWLSSLFAPVKCAETSTMPPPPKEPDAKDDKPEEDPIMFDESESLLLKELEKRYPMRPPSFEAITAPLRMLTHIEPLDGLKVEVGLGISHRMQFTNSWTLPHGAPGNYAVTAMFAGGNMENMMDPAGPNPLMMSRYDPTTGSQNIRYMHRISDDVQCSLNAHYMGADQPAPGCHVDTEYHGHDYIVGAKVGIALDMLSINYTQTVWRNFVAGFELLNMIKPRKCDLSLAGKYISPKATFYGHYMAMQDMLTFGMTIPGNKNITFSTQLDYQTVTGDTELLVGMQVRFLKAKFNASINGQGKMLTHLLHAVNPITKIGFTGEMDFVKQEQKIGITLNLGAS